MSALVRLGCGDAEEGLSRELSCVLAASHLLGSLLCSSGRQQPMGCTSIHAVGLRITPEVPCFQSEACNFSIAAFLFFFSFPTSPFLPPQLSHFVVLRNNIHAVESLAQMLLAAFLTPTERLSVLFSVGADLSPFGAS